MFLCLRIARVFNNFYHKDTCVRPFLKTFEFFSPYLFYACSILVAHSESTAKDGNDYSLLTNEVTFTPGDSGPKNINIEIKQDFLVEEEEHFSIMFTVTDEEDVNLSLDTTHVTIEDSDRE